MISSRRTPFDLRWIQKFGFFAIVGFALSQAGLGQSPYNLTKLPAGSGGFSSPLGINNKGQVVTRIETQPGITQVLLWSRSAGPQTITIGDSSYPAGINDSGQITGATTSMGNPDQAFLWQQGADTQIFAPPGSQGAYANALNNSGTVIGEYFPGSHYFLWTEAQGTQDILSQFEVIELAAINDSSQVIGTYAINGQGFPHGFLWTQAGGLQDLESLGGGQSYAYGINNAGAVVGQSSPPGLVGHAFLWTQAGGMQDMGSPHVYSTAWSINNYGWILGVDLGGAAVWEPGGRAVNITKNVHAFHRLGFSTGAINDHGVVVLDTGSGVFVLSPKMKITVTSTPNPSVQGQPVTFTASINSIVGPPPDGETMQFMQGKKVLATETWANGVAQFTTSSLKTGNHTVGASYGGDENYEPAKPGNVKQVVK